MRRVLNVVVLGVVLSIFVIYCIIVIAVRKIDKREGDAAHVLELREDASSARFVENIYSRAKKSLMEEHIWLSVFVKLPQKSSRVQRISCYLSFLYLTMMTSSMFYREPLVIDIPVNIGPLSLTTQEILVSLVSALITYQINMVIIFLFRKTKLNSMSAANKKKKCKSAPSKQKKKNNKKKKGSMGCCCSASLPFYSRMGPLPTDEPGVGSSGSLVQLRVWG